MTLLELTSAYAAVAAGRAPVTPVGIQNMARPRSRPLPVRERREMLELLSAVVSSGTGRAARLPVEAFGKTGTTQDYRDALFVGFAGDLIVGVWVGNDDNAPMRGVAGGGLPAQIWREFMSGAGAMRSLEPRSRRPEPEVLEPPPVEDVPGDDPFAGELGPPPGAIGPDGFPPPAPGDAPPPETLPRLRRRSVRRRVSRRRSRRMTTRPEPESSPRPPR
jgi:penicillin-binding protein 1A